VDETVTSTVLKRWLLGTNLTELKARNSFYTLQKFVRRAFILNYNSREIDATKELDRITKDIEVPSRNGQNIANNLQL
jgi:hypothetical protein